MITENISKKEFNLLIAKRINGLQKQKNISVKYMSDQIGISIYQIYKYLAGKDSLCYSYLLRMLELLGTSPVDFIKFLPDSKKDVIYDIHKGDTNKVQLLLKEGLDVEKTNNSNATLLMVAVNCDDFKTTELLLKNKANVNARSGYDSPLSLAITNQNTKIVQLLLDHGALNYGWEELQA